MRLPRKRSRRRVSFDRLERRQLLALVLTADTISAPQQNEFAGVVATLVDTNFNDTPSTFNNPPGSVLINWGDGQTSSGLVVGAILPGVFEVDASHVYAQSGTYSTQITVTAQNGQDAIANGLAIVTTEPQQLTIVGNTIAGTAGQPVTSATLATFLDANPADIASDFNALITWGDGQSSLGEIQGLSGAFTVSGTHTYSASGTYTTNVTVIGLNNGLSAFTSGEAKITPPSPYTLTGQQFIETAGSSFTVPVATFTDPNPTDSASMFSAAVNWGDGQASRGNVIGGNGSFTITGSHAYAVPGAYSVVTTLVDQNNHTAMTTSSAMVTGPVLTPVPATITPSLGQPFTGIVASFFDTNTADTYQDLSATINWGNGIVNAGSVVPNPITPGLFDVHGTNTYTVAGTYAVNVLLTNRDGQSATATSHAIVAVPTFVASGTTFPTTPGVPLPSTIVANFIDTNPNATAQNITAVINWGDGQASGGTVSGPNAAGVYTVMGSHTYALPSLSGSYIVTVTIADPTGQTATATSTALVEAPVLTPGQPLTLTFTAGVPPISPVTIGSFFDSNSAASASDFTATINWGVGMGQQVLPGTVTASSTTPGLFLVWGSYLYAAPSTYPISILVQDNKGNSTTITASAVVITNVVTAAPAFGFTGSLYPVGNGPYAALGYTNTNRPTFYGNALPFSIVQLYAKPANVDTLLPLGQTIANAGGQWTLSTGPLAAGIYSITATVTPPGSYPSPMTPLTANAGKVFIDLRPVIRRSKPHQTIVRLHHKLPVLNIPGARPSRPRHTKA
jgi:hypothetical protein